MRAIASAVLSILASSSCKREIVPEAYVPTGAHDAYRHALSLAGLDRTALGRDWAKAAEFALRSPAEVAAPFEERFYVDSGEAFALGYRFSVKRGQKISFAPTETEVLEPPPSGFPHGQRGEKPSPHVTSE